MELFNLQCLLLLDILNPNKLMVILRKKYSLITITETWFAYSKQFSLGNMFYPMAFFHIKNRESKLFGIKRPSHTIENSLLPDINQIFSGFTKNIRSAIAKAEEACINVRFHNDIEGFVKFYNAFANSKGIPLTSKRRLLEIGNHLQLSFATSGDQILAAHSLLMDEEEGIVRILWGGSARLQKDVDNIKVGLANKLLYFSEMIYFKEQGIKIYDWGGYAKDTTDVSLAGINNFKKQYGGEVVECHNYYSISYFLLQKLAGIFGILGKG
jgi:hypothetical protein